MTLNALQKTLCYLSLIITTQQISASPAAPTNPHLAKSSYPLAHANPAQQASFTVSGPLDQSRQLKASEIEYEHLGPGNLIFTLSSPYSNGERAAWSVGVNGISKQNYTRFQLVDHISTHPKPYDKEWSAKTEDAVQNPDSLSALWNAFKIMSALVEAGNLYTLLDSNNDFYVGENDGRIAVYGDITPDDINSKIHLKRQFTLPTEATGALVGINMTFDGRLLALTEDGYLLAIARDFSNYQMIRLNGAVESANADEVLNGWIRNSFAADESGVYIVSRDYMHKVIWNGEKFSELESDGAWRTAYPNNHTLHRGSGATPSLMGFGAGNDKFVVITDGNKIMNMTLFWRDAVPRDWQALSPTLDRRIAGSAAVNLNNPHLTELQSEQSVLVAGYGAVVVNNEPPNQPWFLPSSLRQILVGVLATNPKYRPQGMQKFIWDPTTKQLNSAWVNTEVSSPNSVPLMSLANDTVYTVGTRESQWTLEALDWNSGKSRFHYLIGGARYNSIFSPIVLDDSGRISYGSPWGRVRLSPKQ